MPDRKHMADEVEFHVEHRVPIWNCAGGQSARTDIQRHLPPVVYQRHVHHADLADDLRPHMQGVAGGRPFVNQQRWPMVGPRGAVHVVAPPAPLSLYVANSRMLEAAAACRYRCVQRRWSCVVPVNNGAIVMSGMTFTARVQRGPRSREASGRPSGRTGERLTG